MSRKFISFCISLLFLSRSNSHLSTLHSYHIEFCISQINQIILSCKGDLSWPLLVWFKRVMAFPLYLNLFLLVGLNTFLYNLFVCRNKVHSLEPIISPPRHRQIIRFIRHTFKAAHQFPLLEHLTVLVGIELED